MDNDIYVINLMNANGLMSTYAFMGDTSISPEAFQDKRDEHLKSLKQHLTVTESIWKIHRDNNFSNVFMIQDYILPGLLKKIDGLAFIFLLELFLVR